MEIFTIGTSPFEYPSKSPSFLVSTNKKAHALRELFQSVVLDTNCVNYSFTIH